MNSLFLLLLLLLLVPTAAAKDLKIGAFNVQVFGKSKMSKPAVVTKLIDTLQRYDLVLVQEVRDISETAIKDLLNQLNEPSAANGAYALVLSARLGRTNSKEQLAWFYRPSKISFVKEKQIADLADYWERPPQITYWDITGGNGLPENTVGIVGIHIDPDEAIAEINHLGPVVDDVVATGAAKAGVWVMGDLNADCSYISQTKWKCIRDSTCTTTQMSLYNPTKYEWFIDDDVDTTTSATDCAYDRFVFAKPVPKISKVGVFDFSEKGMSIADIKLVSDHYPIEFTLSVNDNGGDEGAAPSSSSETSSEISGAGSNSTDTKTSGGSAAACGTKQNVLFSSLFFFWVYQC